jgi:hypothetical protein
MTNREKWKQTAIGVAGMLAVLAWAWGVITGRI